MLFLRVYVDPAEVDVVTRFLSVTAGVRHVARSDGVTEADEAVVTADVEVMAAAAVLEGLVREGVHARDLYFVKMDTIDPLEASRTQWFGGDTIAWTDIVGIARANARPAARYLASMAAAGTIAAVGVSTSNEILVVGAMAVSPDLLPLSAMCVGLVGRRRRLLLRATVTLLAGFLVAAIAAIATAAILDWRGFLDHALGSGGLGTLTTTDITTVIVAFAAGVAGMLAFETRAAAAVGVAISVTTIPALAYFSVALVEGDTNDAGGALLVLLTNVVVLIVAASSTLWLQERWRRRHVAAAR